MPAHARRVLCVEDDEDTCMMLRDLLGLIDCEVTTAATAAEASELTARGRFDLYLLDNWLPGGSGVEVCREIRRSDPSAPIVFYSGAGLDSERDEALAAGAQAYLVKPGDVALLVETVRRLLR
jgi:DNA-binding response OmpR family regulator